MNQVNSADSILQGRLSQLREQFLAGLDTKLNEIRTSWDLVQRDNNGAIHIKSLRNLLHELSTTSSTFGLVTISNTVNKLEQFISTIEQIQAKPSREHIEHFSLLLESLESVIDNDGTKSQSPKTDHWDPLRFSSYSSNDKRLVFIVEENVEFAEHISLNLSQHGYQTRVLSNLLSFRTAIQEIIPEAIIMGMSFKDDKNAGAKALLDLKNKTEIEVPVIFVSNYDDLESRLKAVRAGSARYFTKPLDMNKVVDSLSELIIGTPSEPYRIMVIDDDKPLTDFYKSTLGKYGIHVITVNDPMEALGTIKETQPELILIDVYMPACSGFELASIIRQQENFAGISIIFLSNEKDFEQQISVLEKGGDDFLVKPVDPDLLVTSIITRVSRARTLSRMSYSLHAALREVENRNFALNQHSAISITNVKGEIISINDKFRELTGYAKEEIVGQAHAYMDSGVHSAAFFDELWDTIRAGKVWQNELCEKGKNGVLFWANTTIVPFMDEQKRPYQYVAIQNDITARIEAERSLSEAHNIAVNASQAKTDFLSKMSHELRTPLNAILGFSQLLQSAPGRKPDDAEAQYSQEIYDAGVHLLNLINDTLDLSRIEIGQLKIDPIAVPLKSFLEQCCSLVSPIAKVKNILLVQSSSDEEKLVVKADPLRLKQVILNLLSNAIKYNKQNGSVEISHKRENENTIMIEIVDSGTGIPDEQGDILFQPFSRLSIHKQEEGAGIGLALSKHLIELMDGEIGFVSQLNKGTRFWIKLQEETLGPTGIFQQKELSVPVKNDIAKSYTVLYVEDNLRNLSLIKEILTKRPNIDLIHASTAEHGIELAELHHPDIILMDIQLPGMSGLDGLKILKQNKKCDDIPVIAISAYASDQDMEHAYEVGFDEYITKPINVENFLNTIDNFVEQPYLH